MSFRYEGLTHTYEIKKHKPKLFFTSLKTKSVFPLSLHSKFIVSHYLADMFHTNIFQCKMSLLYRGVFYNIQPMHITSLKKKSEFWNVVCPEFVQGIVDQYSLLVLWVIYFGKFVVRFWPKGYKCFFYLKILFWFTIFIEFFQDNYSLATSSVFISF